MSEKANPRILRAKIFGMYLSPTSQGISLPVLEFISEDEYPSEKWIRIKAKNYFYRDFRYSGMLAIIDNQEMILISNR